MAAMPAFSFEALQADGVTRKGVIEADSVKSARTQLRAQQLVPLNVAALAVDTPQSETPWWNRSIGGGRAFSASALTVWTRQLAGLVSSGLPLERALAALSEEAEEEKQRHLVASIRADLGQAVAPGSPLLSVSSPEFGVAQADAAKALADVQLTYQNLDSVELGVTTVDNYFDTLGGITQAVKAAKGGKTPPVYIGDQTKGEASVRSLKEQVALETRTRMLNPKWCESMLEHGYEGVRQIETHVTNTMGWSATTGQVQPWVYQQLTETFMLDPTMRERLAQLNPTASARVANRLIEASERNYWQPDAQTLDALRRAGEELEDRLEGVYEGASA